MQRFTPLQWLVLAGVALLLLRQVSPGFLRDPFQAIATIVALVAAITVHEANHAFVADRLGDPTPRQMGRVTLNPLAHLDPIGTLMMFVARFGWGKPVLFNPMNLRIDPALGSSLVSVAGPAANVATAFVLARVLDAPLGLPPLAIELIATTLWFNIFLAAFNLLPIPPLDGFGFIMGLLPRSVAAVFAPIVPYGPLILIAVLFLPGLGGPNLVSVLLFPVVEGLAGLVQPPI